MSKIETKKVPIKKQSFSLSDYKSTKKLNDDVKDKEIQWIPMSNGFRETIGIDIPKGYVTLVRGYSSVGKSTAMLECIVGCQKTGVLPVIIDTENSFDWEHARLMGVEFNEMVDESTGEVTGYDGFFIYINNDYLIENYGKKRDKNRDEAVVEDVAEFIHNTLDDQASEKLPYELCFLWDSIGSLDCEKSVVSKSRNNMWNAGALETAFKSLLNHRIPSSRKENKQYTNTFFGVQKIWFDSQSGAGVVKHKGGEAFYYAARIIIHLGGVQSHGTARLTATSNKRDYVFATETKMEIVKNHVNGISYKGKIVATPHGFINSTDVESYKKEHKDYLLSKLGLDSGEIEVKKEDSVNSIETEDKL